MKNAVRPALVTLALLGSVTAAPAAAQERDAWVLPRGMVRVELAGRYAAWDERFGQPGGAGSARQPLGAGFGGRLDAANVTQLATLLARLNAALAATEATGVQPGTRATAQQVAFGDAQVAYSAERVQAPFSIAVGVAPRLSVELRASATQENATLQRAGLTGGAVGANPNVAHNQRVLGGVDGALAMLGGGAWLPTAGSALGQLLQARVRAATAGGDTLQLPQAAATAAQLRQAGGAAAPLVGALAGETGAWQLDDVELGARFQLLDGVGAPLPAAGAEGVALRAAVRVAARLPAGAAPRVENPLLPVPARGHAGFGIGVDADAFLGARFWTTVSASYSALQPATVERVVVAPGQTEGMLAVRTLERAPGAVLRVDVLPRFRFAEALSIGARYSLLRIGAESYAEPSAGTPPAATLDVAARTVQQAGLVFRYSTLPSFAAGARVVPLEAYASVGAALTGSAGAPAERTAEIGASVYHRLWGGQTPR